jgi:beta-lactam-binding protein with PASTA domain
VPSGKVISSDPPEGQTLDRGKTVTLTVSKGPQGVSVPSLVGATQDDATAQLQQLGLQADTTEQESDKPAGTVLEQDPAPGTKVDKGATVKLTVAKERPAVPDVTTGNPTLQDAEGTLNQAGYKTRTRDQAAPTPDLEGHVLRQFPEAGTRRSTGATITLVVGTTATPTPTPTDTATPEVTP